MAFKVHIKNLGIDLPAFHDDCLLDVLHTGGLKIRSDCNKYGVCGQCVVRILEGKTDKPDSWEQSLLARKNLNATFRLSCRIKINSDIIVEVPPDSVVTVSEILTAELERNIMPAPAVQKKFFPPDELVPGSQPLQKQLQEYFGSNLSFLNEVMRKVPDSTNGITAVVRNNTVMALEKGDTASRLFGLAVDIGTTTIVLNLYNLKRGRLMETISAQNGQMRFGTDVVSRLTYAFQEKDGLERLHREIVITLNGLISAVCARAGIKGNDIYETVIAANTAMNHLFLKRPVDTLAGSPFTPHFREYPDVKAEETGLCINGRSPVVTVPNIESFVGGDITAGLIATDVLNREGTVLFIDLGTNGEIVLKKGKSLTVTSTAAGPAFEGANITHGMMAGSGAIASVQSLKPVQFETIDDEVPRGICGTGLIDLMALCLDTGIVDNQGNLQGSDCVNLGHGITLVTKDIRQMQMALAAVKSGIKLMLAEAHLRLEDLDTVMIAGAFGNFLHTEHAQRIGLLPPVQKDRIQFVGNAALAGAGHLLISTEQRKCVKAVLEASTHYHLAGNPDFQDCFIDALSFDPAYYLKDIPK